MGFLLAINPMKNVCISAPPHLLPKIQSGENVVNIAAEFQLTVEQTVKHAIELIKRGKGISLSNLKTFCGDANECDSEIQEKLTEEDLCANVASVTIFDRIHHECPNASRIYIEVVLAYYQVRHHLKRLKVPYVDVADDSLVKGNRLIIPISAPKRQIDYDGYDAKPNKFRGTDIDEYYQNRYSDDDPMDSDEDDEADCTWNDEDFDGFIEISDDAGSQHSGSSETSSNSVIEMDQDEGAVNEANNFQLIGIFDDGDVESHICEAVGNTPNQPTSTSSLTVSSFQMSIGSDDDLCIEAAAAYEHLFEAQTKRSRPPLHQTDA